MGLYQLEEVLREADPTHEPPPAPRPQPYERPYEDLNREAVQGEMVRVCGRQCNRKALSLPEPAGVCRLSFLLPAGLTNVWHLVAAFPGCMSDTLPASPAAACSAVPCRC